MLTASALGTVCRRSGTAAAAYCPDGPVRSGPAAAPPVVMMELVLSCAASAVAGFWSWSCDWGWYAVVGECWMLSRLHRPAHRVDVNWAPLSDMMVSGIPNCDTQPAKRALAQSAAVMDESGMASGHLEVRSIIVKR